MLGKGYEVRIYCKDLETEESNLEYLTLYVKLEYVFNNNMFLED